jgi:general secretion pathway protein D
LTPSVNTLRLGLDMSAEGARQSASRGKWRWTLVVLLLPILSACGTSYLEQSKDEPQGADDVVRSADLKPRFAQPTRESSASPPQPRGFSFFGLGTPSPEPVQAAEGVHPDAVGGGGYTLNFEDSPVANVAKAVLGDILGVGYVIDPRAQGTITLSSGRPIDKKDMLFVLENALKANNLLLIRDNEGYRIVAGNDGSVGSTDRGGDSNSAEPGYGLTVMPLRYVSGETLSRLLEGFAARPGAIRTDPSGRILLVLGTGSERQAALDTVRSFDVDWMRGQSVGMYPVRNSDPQPIVTELEKIMDSGDAGLGRGLVKFQSVASSNAILVVAAKPELLRTAAKWIARLDSASTGSAGVEVYKVRYGDAKQIAQTLNDIFLRGVNVSADSATNQIAPGSGSTALSATERLTGGKPNGGSDSNGSGSGGTPAASVQTASAAPFGGLPSAAVFGNAYAPAAGGQGGAVLPGVRITADISNNSVVIYASAEDYRIIERTLNQLDRPKLQVAIEVTIAEVTLNDQLDYGVQFFLSNGAISNTLTGQIPTVANNILANPAGPGLTGGFNLVLGNQLAPRVVINALHQLTAVKILSNPSLVVVDNGEATLEVGDQVPISTGSATVLSANNAVVNTVDYKNTGIILHVQPRVNSNGSVLLAIDQEISSVPQNSTSLTPTISQRKVKSEISVVSGQTVLLAGLISDQQEKTRQGVPILNQLPYVGAAFGTTGTSDARTELIIFIQPQIIRDGADAAKIAEELRSKMRGGKVQALTLPAMLNVNTRPIQ